MTRDQIERILAEAHTSGVRFDPSQIAEICQAALERDELKAEVALARERLGPAGWKLLKELDSLRDRLKEAESAFWKITEAKEFHSTWIDTCFSHVRIANAALEKLRGEGERGLCHEKE